VTLVMKIDDHITRLRSVMEAMVSLGEHVTSVGLWMNSCDDGLTQAAKIEGRDCRQMVANSFSPLRYMYFAGSPNFPTTGDSYITVTYFDGPAGSFALQYDSQDAGLPLDGAYKECPNKAELLGTGVWKQKTFVVADALLANRQNGKSDFRLATNNTDLAVAAVTVSKYPPGPPFKEP
jgi:hypothetical protein